MIFRSRRKKAEQPERVVVSNGPEGEVISFGDPLPAEESPHEGRLEHPEGLRPPDDAPAGVDDLLRKPLPLWDRVKWLLLLSVIFLILVWASMADDPLLPFADATRNEVTSAWWVV